MLFIIFVIWSFFAYSYIDGEGLCFWNYNGLDKGTAFGWGRCEYVPEVKAYKYFFFFCHGFNASGLEEGIFLTVLLIF